MIVDGSCHCGAITFQADVDPDATCICHCTDCQALSGSAFRTVAFAPEHTFKLLSGRPKVYVKTTADSGNRREQTFCPDCGSPIYSRAADRPIATQAPARGAPMPMVGIRAGTLKQRRELAPRIEYFCRSAQPWARFVAAATRLKGGWGSEAQE